MDRRGARAQAAAEFKAYAERWPSDERAPEAQFRAGTGLCKLGRFEEGGVQLEGAARGGVEPWAQKARAELLRCPDYFPTPAPFGWTYVDAETGGRNMTERVLAHDGDVLERRILAGSKLVDKRQFKVERKDWEVRLNGRPVLKYPFRKGTTWTFTEGKRSVRSTIEADGLDVTVRKRKFESCLKVKEQAAGIDSSWKYDYYCPGMGRVKTTVAGPGFEHSNTELSSAGQD
jgi:hypothetical protein